ncbi:MAG TPA: hypothetical protein VIC62_06160 [Nakamurella sp.]
MSLSSEAVDARFWALVCDDEGWLDSEFAGIVGEPAEAVQVPARHPVLLVARRRPRRPGSSGDGTAVCRPGRPAGTREGPWRRPRSPPRTTSRPTICRSG